MRPIGFEDIFAPQTCTFGTNFGPHDYPVVPCEKPAEAMIRVENCPNGETVELLVCLEHFNEVTGKLAAAKESDG